MAELRSCITAGFLLFVLLTPCLPTRGLQEEKLEQEIYEIDYRGPETHSYLPPPYRSNGRHNIHHQNVALHRKSNRMRAVKAGGNGKKIHD